MLLAMPASAMAATGGVRSFAPTGTVPENVSFRIVFVNPIVNKNQTGKPITPENALFPIEVNPPLQLEGRWQNEKTFTARLLAPLRNATSYRAVLKDGLKDRRGNTLSGEFRFQTEPLKPGEIVASMGADNNAYFTLNFNMRLDPERLKGYLRIVSPEGRDMVYNIAGALPSKTIRVSVPVNKTQTRQRYTVKISAGLKSGEGELGLERDITETVVLEPSLVISSLTDNGEKNMRVNFSFPVDPEAVKPFVTFEPPVKNPVFESGWNDEILIIRADDFKPRSRFVLSFRKGLPSKGGLVLKDDFKQAVIMPDLPSEISIPADGTYLSPMTGGLVPIELRNVKRLQLDLWRMYENNIPYVFNDEYSYFDKDIAKRLFSKEIPLNLPLNERVKKSIPIDEMTSGDRGLFLLTARDSVNEWWDETAQLISLSDLGLTVRLWEDAILVWVNSLTSVKSIADARVKIFSSKKQLLAEGLTNSGGVFYYQIPDGKSWEVGNQPFLAVVSKGSDLNYVQLTRNLLDREIFDTSGRKWNKSGYDGFIFQPRDIFRTGETVPFKIIVRNPDITVPEPFPIIFNVRDATGRHIAQNTLALNASGSAVTEIKLPATAQTGTWTAAISVPGSENEPIATHKFYVEDFAPPRIEVKLNSYRQFLTHGDTFTADIYARWLFGADGAGLKYKASWTAKEATFTPAQDRWKGYSFGDPERKFIAENGDIDEKELDHFGAAKVSLKLDDDWQAPTIINVTLRTEVMEDSGRWVTSTISRPFYSSPWLLGIATQDENFRVGKNAVFKIAAVTPAEEPADPGQLSAELYKITWNYNIIEIDGRKRWQSTEELNKVEEKELTLSGGLGEVSFVPESYGSYLVRVSDSDDNARAVYRFYVLDSGGASETGSQMIDRIEIKADKENYKIGQTARLVMRAPFSGLMMITVEGAGLIDRVVRVVDTPEVVYELPITSAMRPNVWVTAWLVRPVNASDAGQWASHRAIGLARIKTDMTDYDIKLGLDAPKKVLPSTKIPVAIALEGASEAVSKKAEVALALVDDGVLGLTRYEVPDLLNHFWGVREANSQAYDIYDQLMPVSERTTEQLHPGGDEGLGAFTPEGNISRFKILSFFNGFLYPDENGVIHTEIEVPEFSGRARLFAVAASGRNFGRAETTIEIARDIVTEAGLPRFTAPSDQFAIPVSVFNTSKENHNVKVSLVPEGLMLDNSFADLKIPAGEKASFTANAKALGGANKAALTLVTSWEDNQEFTQVIELPVRPAWPVISASGTGIFVNGRTVLDIPIDEFDGNIHLAGTLSLADTPAVNINQAVNFLNAYPYGCLEQTISAAWPFLILPDAVAELDPFVMTDANVRERTEQAIARIQSMQLYNGSFAFWPGTSKPNNWASVYATHFLLAAKDNGVNFPDEILTGAMNWLREFLASMPEYNYEGEERDDLTAKAYAVYVLALSGQKPLGWIEYLRENSASLLQSGNIYLAGAQSLIDGKADALRNLNIGKFSGYSGMTFESDARNTALLLDMWLDVEPQAPEVTELALRLSKMRWYSTQDNSAAIRALAKYNISASSAKSDITAHVSTETSDKPLLSYKSGEGASSVRIDQLPKDTGILIEAQGTGQGCYSWNIIGTPKVQPKPERRNINIECLYYDEKGRLISPQDTIGHGEVIQVVLGIKPSMRVSNLVVNYLLPAGFEIENPRIEDGLDQSEVVSDIRDDRLILYFNRLTGERSYGFKMRAVTRGTFKVPQISAVGMYDPSVRFTGSVQPDVIIK